MRRQFWKIIGCSVAACFLAACASTGGKTEGTNGFGGNGGPVVAGLGQDSAFGTSGDASPLEVGNQTYYFDFDHSDMHSSDRPSLEVQAHYLAAHPSARVVLEGNTDPRGSREYNIALGERRANAVSDLLKLQGVADKQIRVVSYGAEQLASQGHSEADYQLDRRVHLVYEAK